MNLRLSAVLTASALTLATSVQAGGPQSGSTYHSPNGQGPFSFALIGDVPYGVAPGEHYAPFDNLIDEVNADRRVKWVMHAGDIKGGGSPCSDEMFADRLGRYNRFDKPVVLTPGDNEWTDCHRVNAGEYQPLERLVKLREVFYPVPGTSIGGRTMQVTSQAADPLYEEFPENVRWTEQGVVFSAIHIVGSNNALAAFDPNSSAVRTAADDEEVARRTAAAIAWLEETFAAAQAGNSPGVFIMIHANPGLERGSADRYGFEEFLAALQSHARSYGKPVVLAHGDSHYFRVDKPSISGFTKNLTRVETFGSGNVHWIKVSVDPQDDEVFAFQQQIVPAN
jgi:hypothetical protein